ncbi:DUF6850 family outer membrane beta-barrel protein [Sphingobacterium gobiense]|uniref:DUF6850 domain-containing protein n=1 Tax=Sphingobacterium gobiense TaxID=1382456 RepID=A0A2S9JTS1_9SPHI|nr:DUF6850 family outer membrane beta-barrel protein [Sphingobacterium gobiense]PRD56674.1 hypothetical protein C5749_05440 [Sphingobacterium gobiense]
MKQDIGAFFGLLILLVGICLPVHGQEVNFLDTIGRKMRYFAVDNPIWMEELMEPRYSDISLAYGAESGGYRAAQQADRSREIAFKSEGSVTIKDVRLWGSFGYRNAREDSTRFGHQTRRNPEAPFYFASYGANYYERSDYQLQVRGQRYFSDKRWSLYGGVDYILGDHFSNNDPRGSIDVFQVDGSLGLGYQLAREWQVGIQAAYGYGQEAVEVGFRNEQYALQSTESPYLNYTVFGYGWRVQDWLLDKGLHYQTNMKRPAFKGYVSHKAGADRFYAYAGYKSDQQRYQQVLRNESRKNELTSYTSNAMDYGVQWHRKTAAGQLYVHLQGLNKRGKDRLPAAGNGLNNYVYDNDLYRAEGAFSHERARWQYDYEGAMEYVQERKSDGGSGTLLDYTQIHARLSFVLTRMMGSGQQVYMGLAVLTSHTPALQWELPLVNENVFHRYVFYHDVNYHQTNSYGGELNMGYRQPLNGRGFLRWGLRYQQRIANGFEPVPEGNSQYRANERSRLNITMAYGF